MLIKIWNGFWTCQDVRMHTGWLFVFGDNDEQRGCGGQAIIRKLHNTAGIPTKRSPGYYAAAYYSDADLAEHSANITAAVDAIIARVAKYEAVVLPAAGLGTGLADLKSRAPRTWRHLCAELARLARGATICHV